MSKLLQPCIDWMASKGWKPFPFQKQTWKAYLQGKDGLVNAPTGSGKTYALGLAILLDQLKNPSPPPASRKKRIGLQAIWITPLRALSKEITQALQTACDELELGWEVGLRTGDTPSHIRQKQSRNMPEILVTTPESLHLLLAQKKYPERLGTLRSIVVDEWHELLGTKRGVQIELALSRLRKIAPQMRRWAISATIGNLDEALEVFLGAPPDPDKVAVIRYKARKKIIVKSVMPDEVETMPWTGHLGISLLPKVLEIIQASKTSLVFTNTRAQAERWYQQLLEASPDLAGILSMHHGSISRELRDWTEKALKEERLKAVVCTSSLDLGVDFHPVESIIQIGGPKGVARFMQRAGRSGHQPGATSRIWFVPTHSLELMEAAALRQAIAEGKLESRMPILRAFDVLVQYLVTLAVSEGFEEKELFEEVRTTFAFRSINREEWEQMLAFVTTGGKALYAYEEFKKVEIEDGRYVVNDRGVAMRHRLSMGTIVSDPVMTVKFQKGGRLGTIEEGFVSRLKKGDVFWFAGRNLEFLRIKDLDVIVRRTKQKKGKVPAWLGGRLPLSNQLAEMIRLKMTEAMEGRSKDPEIKKIKPLLELQEARSRLPGEEECLVELFRTREGYHLCMYPFEGRFVHEAIGALLAYRISLLTPITLSIAVNDYGFELLSDQPIPFEEALDNDCFTDEHLADDLSASVNTSEMAQRKFRDIAAIAGLIFQGYPGKNITGKHLQSSSALFFQVFREYDTQNVLLRQAYDEVFTFQLEEARLRAALQRIQNSHLVIEHPSKPTPLAFPIIVDRVFRQGISSEKMADRIRKMQIQYAK